MSINPTITAPRFTGSIPQNYDRYLGPMFFEAYAQEVASRIDPSSIRVALELCCGTGRLTRHVRRVLAADSRLVASDLSEDMLAIAKGELRNEAIEWKVIDAQQLPFEDNSVDLVVCCFGYMFVPDQVKALAETKRILRTGGTLIFATWDKLEYNGASHVHRKVLKEHLGDSLPETYRLPFSMNDPLAIQQQLTAAGFQKLKTDLVEKNSTCATAREAAYGLAHGSSLYNELIKNPSLMEEILAAVERELTSKYGAAPMVAPMRAIICQAWK